MARKMGVGSIGWQHQRPDPIEAAVFLVASIEVGAVLALLVSRLT